MIRRALSQFTQGFVEKVILEQASLFSEKWTIASPLKPDIQDSNLDASLSIESAKSNLEEFNRAISSALSNFRDLQDIKNESMCTSADEGKW